VTLVATQRLGFIGALLLATREIGEVTALAVGAARRQPVARHLETSNVAGKLTTVLQLGAVCVAVLGFRTQVLVVAAAACGAVAAAGYARRATRATRAPTADTDADGTPPTRAR
jgi:hypothetical protein